ncbi:uncharacterized protein [Nicotiana sylvestris]|uniref:uncharacterized protein n=1 Tax=Nicotiana sylvestris TaxID=4096 RepID=UPI00388C8791
MHFKEMEPIWNVSHSYTKKTYLKTYSNFIQPINNMDMWPQSENSQVAPPEIKSMPGRPKKLKRKEATESRKIGKLSRCGGQVTWNLCKTKGHNKRGCPHSSSSTVVVVAAATVPYAGKGRGRGRGSAPPAAAASSSCGSTSISERGRDRGSEPPAGSSSMPYVGSTGSSRRGWTRGRGSEMDARGRGRGRGRGTGGFESSSGLEGWFNCS